MTEYTLQFLTHEPVPVRGRDINGWWFNGSRENFMVSRIEDAKRMSKVEAEQVLEKMAKGGGKTCFFLVALD